MSRILFKYFLWLVLISIHPINDVQAMEKGFDHQAQRRRIKAQQEAQVKEQERLAHEREEERKVAQQKTRAENEKKRGYIRTAEELLEEGKNKLLERYISEIEAAIDNPPLKNTQINKFDTHINLLLKDEDDQEKAGAVLLNRALIRYLAWTGGSIGDIAIYFKKIRPLDPDADRDREVLMGIKNTMDKEKNNIDKEKNRITEERKTEIEEAKQQGKQEALNRGILIGAGGMATLVATWWGFSYFFGE